MVAVFEAKVFARFHQGNASCNLCWITVTVGPLSIAQGRCWHSSNRLLCRAC